MFLRVLNICEIKNVIETAAKEQNESVNTYIKKAIQSRYAADTGNNIEL